MADADSGKGGSGYGLGLSTRTQVTGYQFLARRTAMALTRWRVRMEVEPGRRQTLAVVASVSAALARVVPYFTVVVAAFVPLAAGVYLLTTTAWTLAERVIVQRARAARPGGDGRDRLANVR